MVPPRDMPKKPTKKAQPRMGRPPRAGVRATARLEVRFTPEELERYVELAADRDISLAQLVRRALDLASTK